MLSSTKTRNRLHFFSQKLNAVQPHCPASDQEALCIQEVLHEQQTMQYGADIVIETDHQNLTKRDLKSPRLLHWLFALNLAFNKGKTNIVADNLSRLPLIPPERKQETNHSANQDSISSLLVESLLYYPKDVPVFPLEFKNIWNYQQKNPVIMALEQQSIYTKQEFYVSELACSLQNQ